MELSTYFRINASETGQFERTLIIADEGTLRLPGRLHRADARRDQLHAAVVELVALDDAEIKYSTVQNWYPGDENGMGGIYNFVTKRADCRGALQGQLDPGRDRLGHHLEVSVLHPARRRKRRRVLLHRHRQHHQQADTGTKMIHLGANTRSRIISKGISAAARRTPIAAWSASSQGEESAQLHPVRLPADRRRLRRPYGALHRGRNNSRRIEHEATTSKVAEDQLFYCLPARHSAGRGGAAAGQRLLPAKCCRQLPMEFAVEAQKLVAISLEGSVG